MGLLTEILTTMCFSLFLNRRLLYSKSTVLFKISDDKTSAPKSLRYCLWWDCLWCACVPLMCISLHFSFIFLNTYILKPSTTSSPARKEEKLKNSHMLKTTESSCEYLGIYRAFGRISSHWNTEISFHPWCTGQHRGHEEDEVLHRPFSPAFPVSVCMSLHEGLTGGCYSRIWLFFHSPDPTETPLWWRFSPFEFRQRKSSKRYIADATQQFTKTDVGFNNFLNVAEQFTYFC